MKKENSKIKAELFVMEHNPVITKDLCNWASELCYAYANTVVDNQEISDLKSEISRLKQRLADCERKRLTGERI